MLHVLTHLDWTLHPRRWILPDDAQAASFERRLGLAEPAHAFRWVDPREADALGLPVPWQRLMRSAATS